MKKILLLLIVLVIIAVLGGWFIFTPASSDPVEKIFVIAKGEGVNEISQNLKEQNFIRNKFIFETYVWLKNLQSKFQAGEHKLRQNMNFWEVAQFLTFGREPAERGIKIIEGWNNQEIADYLEKEGVINKNIFLEQVSSFKFQVSNFKFLEDKPERATLEGYLFPDTYRIYKEIPKEYLDGENSETALANHIIQKMLDNFNRKLSQELRDEIARQKKTIFEIITLASIVEKEVRGDEDRAMVADLFWRRLKIGMPLQADSTVNYVTGKYVSQASAEDLKVDSPYNTYKYKGLPAGPIGNPGLSSIRAVIYPKQNPYWYFLTTEDGQTIYGRNFEEHKANKVKYLQ